MALTPNLSLAKCPYQKISKKLAPYKNFPPLFAYYRSVSKNIFILIPKHFKMNITLKLATFFLGTLAAQAQLIVTTAVDELDAPFGSELSLREAISGAAAGGTIEFDPSLSGQALTLTMGQLSINKNLTIDASGLPSGFIIDADGQNTGHRVLLINPNRTVTLKNLTLTGGRATGGYPIRRGGAIHVDGRFGARTALTLDSCTLTRNSAFRGGAIFADGENGGRSIVTIQNSTLSHNQSDAEGGAIFNNPFSNGNAGLTLTSCTLAHNSGSLGGAIHNHGVPGHPGRSEISIQNCTIAENFAINGGGIDSYDDSASSVTLTLENTILAHNSASDTGPDLNVRDQSATPTTMISLIEKNLLSSLDSSTLTSNPDLIVVPDPKLAPLGYYGGATQTMHPLAGSPAINRGGPPFTRFANGALDIGAVEVGPITLVTTTANDGSNSLRQAINSASSAQGAVIRFDTQLNGRMIELSTQLTIPSDTNGLFIDASNMANGLTIDANQESRVLEIQPNSTVALHGLTLTGGITTGGFPANSGGAIYADGSGSENSVLLTLNACNISGNSANFGGGIYSNGRNSGNANLNLNACNISDNSALVGGGIFSNGNFSVSANVNLDACNISGNSAINSGGGIFSQGLDGSVELSLSACTISGNSANDVGGGIFSDGSIDGKATLRLSACTISSNSANDIGGGIFSGGSSSGSSTLSLNNTILAGNTAPTGPDLNENGDGAVTTSIGNNLISSLNSGHNAITGGTIITGAPHLSPLGHYGGPTQTMGPLPGSPAINAATSSTVTADQRGFAITDGSPDIGAVEFQEVDFELNPVFNSDGDQDGTSIGVELALGTDPFTPDADHPANLLLTSFNGDGQPTFTFGLDNSEQSNIILRLMRSTDLINFDEVIATNQDMNFIDPVTNLLEMNDANPPAGGKAFYRLEAQLRPE